jgi:hypothetical protein
MCWLKYFAANSMKRSRRRLRKGNSAFSGKLNDLGRSKAFSSLLRQRCFLLHVLPRGFVRIRHFGFLSTRNRSKLLPICQHLLPTQKRDSGPPVVKPEPAHACSANWLCPHCAGPMVITDRLTAAQLLLRSPPNVAPVTT